MDGMDSVDHANGVHHAHGRDRRYARRATDAPGGRKGEAIELRTHGDARQFFSCSGAVGGREPCGMYGSAGDDRVAPAGRSSRGGRRELSARFLRPCRCYPSSAPISSCARLAIRQPVMARDLRLRGGGECPRRRPPACCLAVARRGDMHTHSRAPPGVVRGRGGMAKKWFLRGKGLAVPGYEFDLMVGEKSRMVTPLVVYPCDPSQRKKKASEKNGLWRVYQV